MPDFSSLCFRFRRRRRERQLTPILRHFDATPLPLLRHATLPMATPPIAFHFSHASACQAPALLMPPPLRLTPIIDIFSDAVSRQIFASFTYRGLSRRCHGLPHYAAAFDTSRHDLRRLMFHFAAAVSVFRFRYFFAGCFHAADMAAFSPMLRHCHELDIDTPPFSSLVDTPYAANIFADELPLIEYCHAAPDASTPRRRRVRHITPFQLPPPADF